MFDSSNLSSVVEIKRAEKKETNKRWSMEIDMGRRVGTCAREDGKRIAWAIERMNATPPFPPHKTRELVTVTVMATTDFSAEPRKVIYKEEK